MKNNSVGLLLSGIFGAGLVLFAGTGANAADDNSGPSHRVVIHVSSAAPDTQRIALFNAEALQRHYGPDQVAIEVVAYGPGLGMMTKESEQTDRVRSLADRNIRFSACANTIKSVKQSSGKTPQLSDGVTVVPAGVARIVDLQEQGYAYVRP